MAGAAPPGPADRAALRRWFDAAITAVEPGAAVRRQLHVSGDRVIAGAVPRAFAWDARVVLIAAGKAAVGMATAIAGIFGPRLTHGMVARPQGDAGALLMPATFGDATTLAVFVAGHPVPDRGSQQAATAALAAVRGLGSRDLVVVGLSGGASALLAAPRPPLTLADKQATTAALVACGADISAINCVRRHLSLIKGGGLARAATPAHVLTLAMSDVPGDVWATIASGPTVPDPSTWAQALAVIERFDLGDRLPPAVLTLLHRGVAGAEAETAKPGDCDLPTAHHVLIATNADAVQAAQSAARVDGHDAVIWKAPLTGEAATCASILVDDLLTRRRAGWRGVLVAGGETTVRLGDAPGHGGRNQEFALAAARALHAAGSAADGITVLAAGSDGVDGPTDAAGAIVDQATVPRASALALDVDDHLRRHDAYPLFAALGDLVRTGPTGTNVMDLVIAIVG